MQHISEFIEKWEVFVSGQRQPYTLSGEQYHTLLDAMNNGFKGLVKFKSFSLNPAFIVSAQRISLEKNPQFMDKTLSDGRNELSQEEYIRGRKKVEELAKKIKSL